MVKLTVLQVGNIIYALFSSSYFSGVIVAHLISSSSQLVCPSVCPELNSVCQTPPYFNLSLRQETLYLGKCKGGQISDEEEEDGEGEEVCGCRGGHSAYIKKNAIRAERLLILINSLLS